MSKWISVEDRLPKVNQAVLACVNGFDSPLILNILTETCNPMIEGYFKDFNYWDSVENDGQDYEDLVTHWMKLPEMPTKD
jgi:hypothetical protein